MSDWNDRPAGLGALLDEARRDSPTPERIERVRGRLEAELGVALVPSGGPAPRTGSSSLVPALVGAGAIALVVWLLWPPGERAPPSAPAVSPMAAAPTAAAPSPSTPAAPRAAVIELERPTTAEIEPERPTEPETRTVSGAPERSPRAVPAGSAATTEAENPGSFLREEADDPGSSLREEIALLERAMAARDAGDPETAREVLELHRARFPGGVLRPERERLARELAEAVAPPLPAPDPPPEP